MAQVKKQQGSISRQTLIAIILGLLVVAVAGYAYMQTTGSNEEPVPAGMENFVPPEPF